MMSLIYAMAIPTCHLGYFDGFRFFSLSYPIILSSKLCRKTGFYSPISGVHLLVLSRLPLPAAAQMAVKALPPQQRSHQPASTAGEEMEGGARITMVIVLRQEENCANLWKNTNQYLNISDVVEQQTQ